MQVQVKTSGSMALVDEDAGSIEGSVEIMRRALLALGLPTGPVDDAFIAVGKKLEGGVVDAVEPDPEE